MLYTLKVDSIFLIQIKAKENIAKVVSQLKGGSSKILRKEFPELEEFLWGDSFWSDGYFAETIGKIDFSQMKQYIRENKEIMPQKG